MPNEWFRSIPAPGTTRTVTDVASFDTAYAASATGDRIVMRAGTYTMNRTIAKNGLQIMAYGWPGNTAEHVTINGSFSPVTAQDVWFLGLEVTDPAHTSTPTGLIFITSKNTSIINCWLHHSGHDEVQSIADFGADTGGGTLSYGNVMHHSRHVVYVQNKNTNPTKYYAHNYLSDAIIDPEGQGEFIFHLYSSADNTKIRNVHVLQNAFKLGNCLVGGGDPAVNYNTRWENNLFDRANWQGTYDHPGELTFKNNKMYKQFNASGWAIDCQRIHGAGETHEVPNYPQQNVVTGNLIYRDGSGHMRYGTSYVVAGTPPVQHVWDGAIKSDDNVDNNDFRGALLLEHRANGIGWQSNTLADWRTKTNTGGCQYDTNSTLTAGAPPDFYQIWQNDYDADRAMIFAWSNNATIPIVLPRTGSIYAVEDQWGAALFSGGTNYSVPTAGVAFIGIIKYDTVGGGGGGGFPPFVDITSTTLASGTSHNVNLPAVSIGDLLILEMVLNGGAGTTVTEPSTWVMKIENAGGSVPITTYVAVKRITANSGATTEDFVTNNACSGGAFVYHVAAGNWRDSGTVANDVETAMTTTNDPPALDPVNWGVENTKWLAASFTTNALAQLTGTPTSYTNQQGAQFTGCALISLQRDNAVASEDPSTFTYSNNNDTRGVTIAIRPSAGGVADPGATVYGSSGKSAHFRHRRS